MRTSISPSSGFVAVNARSSETSGTPTHTASAATRAELLSKFYTTSDRALTYSSEDHRTSNAGSRPRTGTNETIRSSKPKADPGSVHEGLEHPSAGLLASTSPVPIPNTPSSLMPYTKPTPAERFDDAGPYKAEMVARMEQLQRGDRILPPCDRCRRLHMDCAKNLTACLGCTKKHAKCSWKDVEPDELKNYEPPTLRQFVEEEVASENSSSTGPKKKEYKRQGPGVADEELLGEEESSSDEDEPSHDHLSPRSQDPIQVHVAGTLATRGSPSNGTKSPPEQNTTSSPASAITLQQQNGNKPPSPPPAPVPAHAELAKVHSEIEEVEEVQASRVPNNSLDIQPTIEASGNGIATINGLNHTTNGLTATSHNSAPPMNEVPVWATLPPTPRSPTDATVVAQQSFPAGDLSALATLEASLAPMADMVAKTEA